MREAAQKTELADSAEYDSASKSRQASVRGYNGARSECMAYPEQISIECACWSMVCIQPEHVED